MNREYRENIFTKIIKGEVQAKIVAQDDNFMCFEDINPQAKIHLLVIPKAEYIDFTHFMESGETCEGFFKFAMGVIKKLEIESYRLEMNTGAASGQCVFHFHMHIKSPGAAQEN